MTINKYINTTNLCIIPARGGSKRIPRKNIKDFLGKPIIAYSIEAALKSELFDEVMVSTDDEEIAEVAIKYGAKVPFMRSEENANDKATLANVVDEVKKHYEVVKYFDNICLILPTSALITSALIKTGYDFLLSNDFEAIMPVAKYSYPLGKAFSLKDGKIEFLYPDNIRARTQDLNTYYHDTGQFYWMRYHKGLSGKSRGGFEISEEYYQDIDTATDWSLAELKYKMTISDR